jgi:cysteine-rich repeat protein
MTTGRYGERSAARSASPGRRGGRFAAAIVLAFSLASAHAEVLTLVDEYGAGLGVRHIAIHPTGTSVYVPAAQGQFRMFQRNVVTGELGIPAQEYPLPGAASVVVSPDGKFVYVAGDKRIVVYMHSMAGTLSVVETIGAGTPNVLAGSRFNDIAISPDPEGKFLYVISKDDRTLQVFSRSQSDGRLTWVQLVNGGSEAGSVTWFGEPIALVIAPDGAQIYVTQLGTFRKAEGGVLRLDRDADSGMVGYGGLYNDRDTSEPTAIAIAPDGRNVYVAYPGNSGHIVGVYQRSDQGTLTLLDGGGKIGFSSPGGTAVAPNGARVFVADQANDGVMVFNRSLETGALAFRERKSGYAGIDKAYGIALSPDGKSLYLGADNDSGMLLFAVNNCGDTVVEDGEVCDDGNQQSGDCCSATCQPEPMGGPCTDDGNTCTDDVCGPQGICLHTENTAPCSDGLFCNGTDTCSGGSCVVHAGNPCAGGPECADSCNERSDNCFDVAGTPCTDDGSVCTTDRCDGTGVCRHNPGNAGTECRASAGPCDAAEACNGLSPACPTDRSVASSVTCRQARGICDLAETCTGSSPLCPGDAHSTAVCRPAAGSCDAPEACDGQSDACPPDGVLPAGTLCRATTGACDVAETCNGQSGTCPLDRVAPAGTLCRAANGACDVAESCDGSAGVCPGDAAAPDGTSCDNGDACGGGTGASAGAARTHHSVA